MSVNDKDNETVLEEDDVHAEPEQKPDDEQNNAPENEELTFEDKLEAAIKERLAPIKGKLDKAFSERDEALRKLNAFETEKKKAEREQLIKEGKEIEALRSDIVARDAELEALRSQVTTLTRDNAVETAISQYEFPNAKAKEVVFKEIVSQLEQKEGQWQGINGDSIAEVVASFASSEDYAFLFKAKQNRGTNTRKTVNQTTAPSNPDSLFELPQDKVLEMAMKGQLPRRN